MAKKVLILSSSLRPDSNSEQLAREAGRGALEAGNDVEVLSLAGRDIRYCEGCMACHRLLYCPIQDDANDLIKKVQEADAVVFASPIYYYDICGQLKTFLDRTNPLYGQPYRFRDIYLITVSADDAPDTAKRPIDPRWLDLLLRQGPLCRRLQRRRHERSQCCRKSPAMVAESL